MSVYNTFAGEESSLEKSYLLQEKMVKDQQQQSLLSSSVPQEPYPKPLTFSWRLFHWIMYFNGGVTFFIGSFLLYSTINAAYPSALLYTFGSATFLVADISEWLTNNHVGCFWYAKYEEDYEKSIANYHYEDKNTVTGKLQRGEIGWNFFLSAIGSFFYLVGSSLFLPQVYAPVTALVCFMVASSCIIVAQCWKVYRSGLAPIYPTSNNAANNRMEEGNRNTNHTGRPVWKYAFEHYNSDFSGFLVDFFVIFGALGYLLGSPFFFPTVDVNSHINDIGATIFTFGGIFYICSGSAMFYRYMFTENYPH